MVISLGVVHMEEELQDRVQVEVGREVQGVGETHGKEQGEEQRSKEQTHNRSSWMTMDAHKHVLEPIWCNTSSVCALCRRKMTCGVPVYIQ